MNAIILGATGLIGKELLKILLKNKHFQQVFTLTRSELKLENNKHQNIITDFEKMQDFLPNDLKGDTFVYSCLGTTIKKAGSQDKFKKVDFDYVYSAALLAQKYNYKGFYLVTAIGADAKSMVFYTKTKGQIENAVKELGIKSTYVFRPSLLLGEREENRMGEKIGIAVDKLFSPLMSFGPLKKYKGIEASKVAENMLHYSLNAKQGFHIIENDEMLDLGS